MDLTVELRDKFGKQVKQLRKSGVIPAELYGKAQENKHLSVSAKEFSRVFKEAGTNTVVNLQAGKEKIAALIHSVVRNYVSGDVDHVDFYRVRMDEKITAKIPLEFTGEAPAVKEKSGILNKAMSEIEVEALPADLPHRLSVDLSTLDDLNKSVYVRDIKVPKGVELLVGPETVIATVTPQLEEEVVAAPMDVADIKVEAEEKVAERAEKKEAAGEEKK